MAVQSHPTNTHWYILKTGLLTSLLIPKEEKWPYTSCQQKWTDAALRHRVADALLNVREKNGQAVPSNKYGLAQP